MNGYELDALELGHELALFLCLANEQEAEVRRQAIRLHLYAAPIVWNDETAH